MSDAPMSLRSLSPLSAKSSPGSGFQASASAAGTAPPAVAPSCLQPTDGRTIWFGGGLAPVDGVTALDTPPRPCDSTTTPSSRLARLVRPGTPLRRLVELRALAAAPHDGQHLRRLGRAMGAAAGGSRDYGEDDDDEDDAGEDNFDRFADARESSSHSSRPRGTSSTASSSDDYRRRPATQRYADDAIDAVAFSPCSSVSGLVSTAGTDTFVPRHALPRAPVFYHPSAVRLPHSHHLRDSPAPNSLVKAAVTLFESCADDELDDNAADYPRGALRPDAEPHEEARFYHASCLYDNDDTYVDSDEDGESQADHQPRTMRGRQDTPLSYPSLDIQREPGLLSKRQYDAAGLSGNPMNNVEDVQRTGSSPDSPSGFYHVGDGVIRQEHGRPNSVRNWVASRRAVSCVRPAVGGSHEIVHGCQAPPLHRTRSYVSACLNETASPSRASTGSDQNVSERTEQQALFNPRTRPDGVDEPWSCPPVAQMSRFAVALHQARALEAIDDAPLSARELRNDPKEVVSNRRFMELMEISATSQARHARPGRDSLFARIGRRFGFGS